jgi:hypothetical protein
MSVRRLVGSDGAVRGNARHRRRQTVQLDEGTFRVLVGGREVGVETFSIRQNGEGADAVIIAQGRVVLTRGRGSEVVANVQLAGAGLRPVAYDVELRGGDARRIRGTHHGQPGERPDRFPIGRDDARVPGQRRRSDSRRRCGPPLLLHRATRCGRCIIQTPIIVPRESRQVQATVHAGPARRASARAADHRPLATKLVVTAGGDRAQRVGGQPEPGAAGRDPVARLRGRPHRTALGGRRAIRWTRQSSQRSRRRWRGSRNRDAPSVRRGDTRHRCTP